MAFVGSGSVDVKVIVIDLLDDVSGHVETLFEVTTYGGIAIFFDFLGMTFGEGDDLVGVGVFHYGAKKVIRVVDVEGEDGTRSIIGADHHSGGVLTNHLPTTGRGIGRAKRHETDFDRIALMQEGVLT